MLGTLDKLSRKRRAGARNGSSQVSTIYKVSRVTAVGQREGGWGDAGYCLFGHTQAPSVAQRRRERESVKDAQTSGYDDGKGE